MGVIMVVALLLAVVILLGYAAAIYNGLIALSNNINKAWANINVLLKQRHDEIPKLIKICEGYMDHERDVFDRVMKAREALMSAKGPAETGAAENTLQGSLRQLFALAENYPDLKAQTSFQQLQQRVSAIESQIADRREFYNDSVNSYNIRIASVPDLLVARIMGLTPKEMFQVLPSEREDVEIEFSSSKRARGQQA
jgi:LemA protein